MCVGKVKQSQIQDARLLLKQLGMVSFDTFL